MYYRGRRRAERGKYKQLARGDVSDLHSSNRTCMDLRVRGHQCLSICSECYLTDQKV